MRKQGFLFDVDGCLTYSIANGKHLSADPDALEVVSSLQGCSALITGRGFEWIKRNVLAIRQMNIPIFLEYGLVSLIDGNLRTAPIASDFQKITFKIENEFRLWCTDNQIPISSNRLTDPPKDGSAWIEDKNVMLSVASNLLISPVQIHQIMNEITSSPLFNQKIRCVPHQLGFDILPFGTSKKKAALEAIDLLDPYHRFQVIHIFGDNLSDKEMTQAYPEKSIFYSTANGASKVVVKIVKQLLQETE